MVCFKIAIKSQVVTKSRFTTYQTDASVNKTQEKLINL